MLSGPLCGVPHSLRARRAGADAFRLKSAVDELHIILMGSFRANARKEPR